MAARRRSRSAGDARGISPADLRGEGWGRRVPFWISGAIGSFLVDRQLSPYLNEQGGPKARGEQRHGFALFEVDEQREVRPRQTVAGQVIGLNEVRHKVHRVAAAVAPWQLAPHDPGTLVGDHAQE